MRFKKRDWLANPLAPSDRQSSLPWLVDESLSSANARSRIDWNLAVWFFSRHRSTLRTRVGRMCRSTPFAVGARLGPYEIQASFLQSRRPVHDDPDRWHHIGSDGGQIQQKALTIARNVKACEHLVGVPAEGVE
jgi:hypothetical protein